MPNPAAVRLGLGQPSHTAIKKPGRRSLLRLRGSVAYWHHEDGQASTWGVLKSDGKIKFHCHISEIRNSNRSPQRDQRVEFSPRPPRAKGELNRAVDVFIDKDPGMN